MVLQTFQALFPRDDVGFLNKICLEATFAKIQFISKAVTSESAFVDFARETAATLCCLNALLWESLLRLVVGRSSVKQSLCAEYYHRKAERFQELYFSCARDRCASVLSSQGCLTGAYRSLAKAIREFQFSSVVPPLEAFCPDVDECPSRPVVVFEENYDRFGDLCPLCGLIPQYAGCISEVHLGVQSRAGGNGSPGAGPAAAVVAHHPRSMSTSGSPTRCYTPMLFSNSQVADPASTPPVRKMPVETDKRAYDRYRKLKLRLNLFGSTNWVMSDPEFVNLADRSLVFRQLHGSCEAIGAVYRSAEPIHFVVFVNGLGGKSSDFFWAKRWMKLLIATPKHILIWSEANEQEQTFDEISVCGARLAIEVASYLDNIGTTNFKLSFVGFSLGCVLVRAALTCAQLRPYIRNLHTFFSLNGPHLGVVYAKNRFLRFQISVLSKISMKGSMKELTFQDSADIRKCYLYILSRAPVSGLTDDATDIVPDATHPQMRIPEAPQPPQSIAPPRLPVNSTSVASTTKEGATVVHTTTDDTAIDYTTTDYTTTDYTTTDYTTTDYTTTDYTTTVYTTTDYTTTDCTTTGYTTADLTTKEDTTVEPTTVKPTTAQPTRVEPTTVEPTTVEPTTVKPTTVKPTRVEPTTVTLTTIEPTTVEQTTVESTVVYDTTTDAGPSTDSKLYAGLTCVTSERATDDTVDYTLLYQPCDNVVYSVGTRCRLTGNENGLRVVAGLADKGKFLGFNYDGSVDVSCYANLGSVQGWEDNGYAALGVVLANDFSDVAQVATRLKVSLAV
ncbi:hypothetical protein V5799_021093 [Amblyomma americanum]|uniref:DUF676 domain-containing protein n=1 Tax=Amblyomma americanum TaxID=6943 RepID=A0AAQ4FRI2_AMBAM